MNSISRYIECQLQNLSPRETAILELVALGLTTKRISDELNISPNTVLHHLKSVHIKLDVNSRQHAVAKAMGLGLILT